MVKVFVACGFMMIRGLVKHTHTHTQAGMREGFELIAASDVGENRPGNLSPSKTLSICNGRVSSHPAKCAAVIAHKRYEALRIVFTALKAHTTYPRCPNVPVLLLYAPSVICSTIKMLASTMLMTLSQS